jgi:hypothetical protein
MKIMINQWILGYPIVRQTHPLMFQHSTLATMITMTHSRPIVSLHFERILRPRRGKVIHEFSGGGFPRPKPFRACPWVKNRDAWSADMQRTNG